jgi:hypothetical protein
VSELTLQTVKPQYVETNGSRSDFIQRRLDFLHEPLALLLANGDQRSHERFDADWFIPFEAKSVAYCSHFRAGLEAAPRNIPRRPCAPYQEADDNA